MLVLLGVYLSIRGYHSRDGDQAYRLPLLLHKQDPALYADDPFVRAFDAFNPHLGALTLLDAASRPLGLSAGLAGLFALTFVVTCLGLDRLARAIWPEEGTGVGLVAVGLVLMAKAGNIGTNHLFEAMLLDRLIGFALGWLALAVAVSRPGRGLVLAPLAIGLATLVHPSVGLQLGLLLGASWVAWSVWPGASAVGWRRLGMGLALLGLAMAPGLALTLGQGDRLFRGLPPEEFRLLERRDPGTPAPAPALVAVPAMARLGLLPGPRLPGPGTSGAGRRASTMAGGPGPAGPDDGGQPRRPRHRLVGRRGGQRPATHPLPAVPDGDHGPRPGAGRALRPRHRPVEARPAARPLPRHAAGRGADRRLGPGGRHRLRRFTGGDGSRAVASGRRTAVGTDGRVGDAHLGSRREPEIRARSDRGRRRAGVRTRLPGASRHRVWPPADPRGAGRAGRLDAVRERSLPRLGVDTATAGLGRGLGVGDPPGRPGRGGRAGNRVEDRRVAGGAMSVRGRADRRRGAAGRLVPRPHAPLGAVHRAPRPEDVPALVPAQPGVQSGGKPLSRRGPRRLVGPVPRPRRLRRRVVGLRPRLPGGSPRPGTAL